MRSAFGGHLEGNGAGKGETRWAAGAAAGKFFWLLLNEGKQSKAGTKRP